MSPSTAGRVYRVSTSAEVRALDAYTIETLGVPGLALMEVAGRALTRELLRRFEERAREGVVVLAGPGNNGGDGWVIARLLHGLGLPVHVLATESRSEGCRTMRAAAERTGVPTCTEISEAALLVDALLGTGLSSDLRGEVRDLVGRIRQHPAPVVAVDLPTGLCGDTGRVMGTAAPAALTVTFGRARIGHFLEPGPDLVGELVVADIGLQGPTPHIAEILDGAALAPMLPSRAHGSHKGSYGHLGVVAGSAEMIGAAVLTCTAALRAGCGLVTLHLPETARAQAARLPPEVMVSFDDPGEYTALAVGPGLGKAEPTRHLVRALWSRHPSPAVFDADGLNHLQGQPSDFVRCITPHPGEAGRLLETSAAEVQADRLGAVRALGQIAPTLLKGRNTLISGSPVRINRTGGPMLATAGAGDVLTGIVGSLLAQGLVPRDALTVGAFLHGLAGEIAGPGPLVASDLVPAIPKALARLPQRRDVLGLADLWT